MDLEHEEPCLRATITYLRMIIPIVANPRAEASLQKLANAMERRKLLCSTDDGTRSPMKHRVADPIS
jgi:hypothetical protein